ncbi:hypothetical protein HNQ77_005149 [Silvibacterium bohemicum]|uniref:Cadherin-like beta-sandwich-like domain-containing protein n=1 Tax=Silvibacterium bohemicum TaxID=1577686 RepID=A0A841KA47_9BACT|nr:cadherin-like beta sandwich domain-containing protein [Silvibacterium bohemicum]MBB6147164.1 hypothetical protein [Silvibacterium bohemicum]
MKWASLELGYRTIEGKAACACRLNRLSCICGCPDAFIECRRRAWPGAVFDANQLTALTVSAGTLNPSFHANVDTYTVRVDQRVAGIQVGATTEDPNATITIAGQTISSGGTSSAINLKPGKNLINVVATSVDGASRTYAVIVIRGGY